MAQPIEQDTSEQTAGSPESTEERSNLFLFGFSHGFRLVQSRGNTDPVESSGVENVYGFLFGYERIVHRHVAVSIVKPFYFNRDRVDSQLEIVVTGIFRKNHWEPFVGGGVVSLLSRLKNESESPGDTIEFSVGLLFVTGFKYVFTSRWAFELELGYEFIPKDANFEHGFADSYQGAYFF
ncbi:MAG: hypothetical protein PVI24_15840 [Myxococcales bacterium]